MVAIAPISSMQDRVQKKDAIEAVLLRPLHMSTDRIDALQAKSSLFFSLLLFLFFLFDTKAMIANVKRCGIVMFELYQVLRLIPKTKVMFNPWSIKQNPIWTNRKL